MNPDDNFPTASELQAITAMMEDWTDQLFDTGQSLNKAGLGVADCVVTLKNENGPIGSLQWVSDLSTFVLRTDVTEFAWPGDRDELRESVEDLADWTPFVDRSTGISMDHNDAEQQLGTVVN